jgi:hypothetical protein
MGIASVALTIGGLGAVTAYPGETIVFHAVLTADGEGMELGETLVCLMKPYPEDTNAYGVVSGTVGEVSFAVWGNSGTVITFDVVTYNSWYSAVVSNTVTVTLSESKELSSYTQTSATATETLSGASKTLTLNIPVNSKLILAQLRVNTLVSSVDGGTLWEAHFSGGSNSFIATNQAFTKNTKSSKMLNGEITEDVVTNIVVDCVGGTFFDGEIRAIVYYEVIGVQADAA